MLRQGIQGISELITEPGLINVDFADVKTIMSEPGNALMAIGRGSGDQRAIDAAKQAIASPLLDVSMEGARGVLLQHHRRRGPDPRRDQRGGRDHQPGGRSRRRTSSSAAVIDPAMGNEVKITLIATGFDEPSTGFGPRGRRPRRAPPRGPRFPVDDPPTAPPRPRRPRRRYSDDPSPFDDDENEIDIPPFLRGQRRRQR